MRYILLRDIVYLVVKNNALLFFNWKLSSPSRSELLRWDLFTLFLLHDLMLRNSIRIAWSYRQNHTTPRSYIYNLINFRIKVSTIPISFYSEVLPDLCSYNSPFPQFVHVQLKLVLLRGRIFPHKFRWIKYELWLQLSWLIYLIYGIKAFNYIRCKRFLFN